MRPVRCMRSNSLVNIHWLGIEHTCECGALLVPVKWDPRGASYTPEMRNAVAWPEHHMPNVFELTPEEIQILAPEE